jgi:isopentenyl diphosphate isomerase/L-lactate dehydrogenase-like FMN-dependent dehydrogenase
VLIGRPFLYALAVGGADAVAGMLEMLRQEIEVSMSLLGIRHLSELSQDLLVRA